MDLTRLFILIALSLSAALFARWRNWALLALSVFVLFWLQPGTPIRNLSFWFPVESLVLVGLVWVWTRTDPSTPSTPSAGQAGRVRSFPVGWMTGATLKTVAVIGSIVLVMGLLRYVELPISILAARPPDIISIIIALVIAIALPLLASRPTLNALRPSPPAPRLTLIIAAFIVLFVLLKFDLTALAISMGLRGLNGQAVAQASALDLRWLGFSYIAFRLIHVLREKQNGKLPEMSLQEFMIYVIFFPAISAGPIDRSDRFLKDLRAPYKLTSDMAYDAGRRVIVGIFKKYALADTLALIALNEINAAQIRSGATPWAWLLVYAYALRIYFDFSGYTDIATGLGRWFGIKLPENFNAPYLKPNLTQFWNSWHMSLSQWFRAYWFNPLTRALRKLPSPTGGDGGWSQAQIVFVGQASTMLLIALWHGITLNFVVWGVWHALGLFVHNRWAEFAKAHDLSRFARVGHLLGPVLTFHYVALGWVWFALPTLGLSIQTFMRMVGR